MLLLAGGEETVELTQSDLFSLPDWQHKSLAMGGFVLGMTRAQVLELAGSNRLELRPNMPVRTVGEMNGLCRQGSYSVSNAVQERDMFGKPVTREKLLR